MAARLAFTEEEMMIDEGLGFPKAYAKLCRDPNLSPYSHGPPYTFIPYILPPQEAWRSKELDQMFPVIDPEAIPSTKPKIFVSILWKQLHHLGNAGFDPAKFRVDPYGNVLYYHADSASPLAWEIDHWFPCSRGGRTVPCNLRLLQWQVCKKKHNKLEFLVPWWDLQLGISVNQFLSIFASSNSDFRNRAFSLLFSEGENEELNASQTVESHIFPQRFVDTKQKVGLAPAAIVFARRELSDPSSALKSLDLNRQLRPNSPATAARKFSVVDAEPFCKSIQKFRPSISKENDNPESDTNPYMAIAMARDSLKQREETQKMQAEIHRLDMEMVEMKQKTEEERLAIQDLELVLIKQRRRAEKCRRLAESQSSYRILLEKMIRDAMHQSVVYKEQVRLNQVATSSLMARLEAQKAICDSSEKELHRKFKQRDEIEKQIRPQWEQARKRSRIDDTLSEERDDGKTVMFLPGRSRMDDDALFEESDGKTVLYLPGLRRRNPSPKELRVLLEEEQKASEAGRSLNEERKQEELEEEKKGLAKIVEREKPEEKNSITVGEDEIIPIEDKIQKLEIEERKEKNMNVFRSPIREEDEECRKQRGKGNVEKWLRILLENTEEGLSVDSPPKNADEHKTSKTDEIIRKLNLKNPQKEIKILKLPASSGDKADKVDLKLVQDEIEPQIVHEKDDGKRRGELLVGRENSKTVSDKTNTSEVGIVGKGVGSSKRFEEKERRERSGKESGLVRSESARAFRPIPSSPSMILGMRKGVDCIGKKPMVIGDDEDSDNNRAPANNFIKSSIKSIKKAVKI